MPLIKISIKIGGRIIPQQAVVLQHIPLYPFNRRENHQFLIFNKIRNKVEKILKGSLDSIPSPSPTVKIQIMGGKVCLRCKGKTFPGVDNKLL